MNTHPLWFPLPTAFRRAAALSEASVLLETAKPDRADDQSLLFLNPIAQLQATNAEELDTLLEAVDRSISQGFFVAGYFAYECGEHFVGLPQPAAGAAGELLAWLGVYSSPARFDHRTGLVHGSLPISNADDSPSGDELSLRTDGLQISREEYAARIDRIQKYLASGDTYQVNFTDKIYGNSKGTPHDMYAALLEQQPVSFAAYLNRPEGTILSFSPELFYRVSAGKIVVRPMKGTWARGLNTTGDREAAFRLKADEKNRSEHITIVDLLRNDVGRVSELGTVKVEKLLEVERYETLLQMTSTISGQLYPRLSAAAVFRTLFPSGSITGAPKQRTMEIIRELESTPRAVYTGSIGYFAPGGNACFNVAIRTLSMNKDGSFWLGVGSGITADSRAEEEYEECRLKAAFLTRRSPSFSLIETMHCAGGIGLLTQHLTRLADSASYFDIRYDEASLRSELEAAACSCADRESRVRMELHRDGTWSIACSPLETPPWRGQVLLASEHTASGDLFLHHKTTHRGFYHQWLRKAVSDGYDEVLFLNELRHITEGAISNLFFQVDDVWFTPALECGVLPGVQRAELLQRLPKVHEGKFGLEELQKASAIWMCNALRGVRPVSLIKSANETIWRLSE